MLHDDEHAPAINPAQARVTAEELAAALVALEARRDQGQADTIAVGEALQELGLDAAPEEVWAEVQGERARKAASQAAAEEAARRHAEAAKRPPVLMHPPASPRRPRLFIGGLAALFVAHGLAGACHGSCGSVSPPTAGLRAAAPAGFGAPAAAVYPAALRTDSLANVPDGETVYCDPGAMSAMAHGESSDAVRVRMHPLFPTDWSLVKHGNRVYVRGSIQP